MKINNKIDVLRSLLDGSTEDLAIKLAIHALRFIDINGDDLGDNGNGNALQINDSVYTFFELVCAGRIWDMGYTCYIKPGHSGQCFSRNKGGYFTPENFPIFD